MFGMLQQVLHFTTESVGFDDHSSLLITITVHLTQLTFHTKNASTAKMCQILLSFSPIDINAHSQSLKPHWLPDILKHYRGFVIH